MKGPAPVYVVDDDASTREGIASLLRSADLPVETLASAQEFLGRYRTNVPSCLILDVKLPGLSGLELQQELAKANVQIPIIFLTGYADVPMTVRAMKCGALEFFTKPFDRKALLAAVREAMTRPDAARSKATAGRSGTELVGCGPGFKALLNRIAVVAHTDSSVLITGETGTGKEVVARSIHAQSQRAMRPLVSVNCAAFQPTLIASELFGHEKGAFTGALQQRLGRFELADGGTVFLDEIGEVPVETQVALLRVLQEHEFERVGGNKSIRVDVRIIAATNRDLNTAIAEGKFRADLFYRLNVLPIHVPPLRDRKEDIPLLVEHFLRHHASTRGRELRTLDETTTRMLESYPWPGNVRELQNVIERWAALCESGDVSMDESWLPAVEAGTDPGPEHLATLTDHVEAVERKVIHEALEAVHGNQSEAARRLGMSRGSLLARLRKYGPLV